MTDEQKKKLEQTLWDIADTLRGKMNADQFRDYILGFIFYKYLSERMFLFAQDALKADGISFLDIDENTDEGREYLAAIKDASVDAIGYFLKPSELFTNLAKRGLEPGNFIIEDLNRILRNIESSTMGTDSEDDFDDLFSDMDLSSNNLGRTEEAKNTLIAKVLTHLDVIDFELENSNSDVLGDAYEYLIGKFASGAGKKAGEFYTPQEVSTILARIITSGRTRLRSVYDPTCGSGSLLLRVNKEAEVGEFFGQEMNRTTYNLARMNMILHGVHYARFDLKQDDTLENPLHVDQKFDAVVANPPFSAKWSSNPILLTDDRFARYGKLAPASKADFAFVQHMLHQLDDSGTMAVILPHGVLFRGAAEGHIREYLIKECNWLDAVIGLPANIFYGTSIPTCILVLKKCREHPENVLFVDASDCFEKAKNQNVLLPKHIDRIVNAFRDRKEEDRFAHLATLKEIEENDFNLNIPRYVDTFEPEPEVDLAAEYEVAQGLDELVANLDQNILSACAELSVPFSTATNLPYLEAFKRGMMQRLFSGDLRFRRDDGSAFPDWEEKRLGDIANRIKAKNKDLEFSRVLTNSATQGVIDQGDYFDRDIANAENIGGYYICRKGDFVYNPRISTSAPVGPIKRNDLGDGVMSPLYTVFRFRARKTDYFARFFESSHWFKYMKSVANYGARHDRMAITASDFLALPIPFPHLDEQAKIAEALSALDAKIDALNTKISEMETFKRGLLQKMFV